MADNVVDLNCETVLDIPAEKILEAAKDKNLRHVVIVGEDKDGEEFFASTTADSPLIIWMLERAKLEILRMADDDEYEIEDD